MRTLIEKEIRLLLPAFLGALALAILPIWLWPYDSANPSAIPANLYLFGIVLLALSSFGREFGLKTLPFLLAQPLKRARIWWTKITVLAVLAALASDAWWLSGGLRSIQRTALVLPPELLGLIGLCAVVFTAGALWMTLLVRQTIAAFWLTLLIPMAMVSAIKLMAGADWLIFTALGLYAAAGFFLARRQFLHAQDTAWTGGVLSFGRARAAGEQCASRERRPWAALFRKELQLQQVTLMGIVCLLVLHLGVVVLRKAGAQVLVGKTILSMLEMFGGLWLIAPLLAGSQSVADERQLGTLDGLLCLPVSRRIQFAVKMIFVLALGGLLSGALLCAVESFASAMGAGANLGVMGISFKGGGIILVCFAFLALALIGFYASTLTRGIVPALGAGAVASIVFWGIDRIATSWNVPFRQLWPLMAIPTLAAAVIWLAFGNFRYVLESGRRWRRNIFGLIAVLVVINGSVAAAYYRVWEWAMPLEGRHGPARLPAGKPILFGGWNSSLLAVVLPDGRLWTERVTRDWPGQGGSHFVPGSNWVAACAHGREMVGIRSDGTLWVSEKPLPSSSDGSLPPLAQFGVETDWQDVGCDEFSLVILLKRDGTLWRWGNNSLNSKTYQGLRALTPRRLGVKSDWARILRAARSVYAWERDGAAWNLRDVGSYPGTMEIELDPATAALCGRVPSLDHVHFQGLDLYPRFLEAGVRGDGTLWCWNWNRNGYPRQIGKDSNWAAVASGSYHLVALKTDGSIWKWNFDPRKWNFDLRTQAMDGALQEAPARMGTHNDWVGLGVWLGDVVTLSSDGTVWSWRGNDFPIWLNDNLLLAPSRRPAKIENIFDAAQ